MGTLYTLTRPKLTPPDPLPQPLVPYIIKLQDEISSKCYELAVLKRAAEVQDLERYRRAQLVEKVSKAYSRDINGAEMPGWNDEDD